MKPATYYQRMIAPMAPKYDPRHIEAYMRLQYGTLSHLDRTTFVKEVKIACQCIDADKDGAEKLAQSYGF